MSMLSCGRLILKQSMFASSRATFATQKVVDPIQKAFVEKLREYQEKSKTANMGLVGATDAQVKNLNDSMAKLDKVYGASGVDMTQFPTIHHAEPELVMPGSAITVDYPKHELLGNIDESVRVDGELTRGPIVI